MRKALLLILLSGTAAAQAPKPAPAPAPAEQASPASSRPLNLKLDGRAADYTRESPREEATGGSLPGLGEGAMAIEKLPTPRSESVRSPYPATDPSR